MSTITEIPERRLSTADSASSNSKYRNHTVFEEFLKDTPLSLTKDTPSSLTKDTPSPLSKQEMPKKSRRHKRPATPVLTSSSSESYSYEKEINEELSAEKKVVEKNVAVVEKDVAVEKTSESKPQGQLLSLDFKTGDPNTDMYMDFVYDIVVKIAMKKFEDFKLDNKSVVDFAARLMEIVEKFPIKGVEKKIIVLRVLEKFANKEYKLADINDPQQVSQLDQLKFIIVEVIPFTIDTIVSVSKNEIVVKYYGEARKWCLGLCKGNSDDSKKAELEKMLLEYEVADKKDVKLIMKQLV